VFLFVLRRNAALDRSGRVPATYVEPWYLADQLMMSEEEARHGLSRTVTAGLLDVTDGHVSICGWSDEWAKAPLDEAERKRRERERKKAASTNPSTSADDVTDSHGRDRTDRDGPDSHALDKRRGEEKRGEKEDSDTPAAVGLDGLKAKVDNAMGDIGRQRLKRPKPNDPTPEERASAIRVLGKLSARNGVRYTGSPEHLRIIVSQLRNGATETDLRKVIGYCAIELEWADKPEMATYLRPETLFGPKTINRYLDPARTWFEKQGLSMDDQAEGAA
jgi:uncharacterized phage protein (TIGR02220 family)